MYEFVVNPNAAAAASSSAGAGGGGRIRRPEPVFEVTSSQSILFYQSSDDIFSYFIYNFGDEKLTDIKQLVGDSYSIYPVTNGGFCVVTQNESGVNFFYFLNLNGDILWQDSNTSSEYWDVEAFSRYSVPYYEKDGKYKLAILDLQGVREMTFDYFIEGGGYSYDDVHNGGFSVREEPNDNLYKYYIIPDDSTTPILFKEYDPQIDTVNLYQYAFSDKLLIVKNYSSFEVYNSNGELIADFGTSTFTSNFNLYDFTFLDETGSFLVRGRDDENSNLVVLFYSGSANNFSYKLEDDNIYDWNYDFGDQKEYEFVSNFHSGGSATFMFYNFNTSYSLNGFNYYNDVKLLPIFSSDSELRDYYTFSFEKGIHYNLSFTRNSDYINFLIDTDPLGIYYFSDNSNTPNEINNGGDGMYSGGNKIYGDDTQIIYTHTQLRNSKEGGMRQSDFPIDGITSSGFGTSSQYFTNLYPGLFVFAAQDVDVNKFSIDGSVGIYDGVVATYSFEKEINSKLYKVFVKTTGGPCYNNTYSPSVNHIIIIRGSTYSNTTQTVGGSAQDDDHVLDNLVDDDVSEIYYLLTSQVFGQQITNEESESISTQFLNIVDSSASLGELLTNLNQDYSNITNVLKQRGLTYSILRLSKSGSVDVLPINFSKSQFLDDFDKISERTVLQIGENVSLPNLSYGWNNLSDVEDRIYSTFKIANAGEVGYNVLSQNFVMRDIINNQYWAIDFSQWTQGGNGGGFAYSRQLIVDGTFSGDKIYFTHSNYGDEIDIISEGILEITRGTSGPIYNRAVENESNSQNPTGTEWNSQFSYDYEVYTHLPLKLDGSTANSATTYEYDNQLDGKIHIVFDEVEQVTYISNANNNGDYTEYDFFYTDSTSNYDYITEDNIRDTKFLLYSENKNRIVTATAVSQEFTVDMTGDIVKIIDRFIFNKGVIIVRLDLYEVKFLFYNLLGELITEKSLTSSGSNVVANNGDRSAIVWWGEDSIRKVIFFDGEKITEFDTNTLTNIDYSMNDYEWWN